MKKKLLIGLSIVIGLFIALLVFLFIAVSLETKKQNSIHLISDSDLQKLSQQVNAIRGVSNTAYLVEDPRLDTSAQAHCADMVRLNEWGHNLSDGTTPQTFISKVIPNWKSSGENTTWGWSTETEVFNKLVASPEHLANMLNKNYTLVGYATCQAKNYPNIVIQEFVGF